MNPHFSQVIVSGLAALFAGFSLFYLQKKRHLSGLLIIIILSLLPLVSMLRPGAYESGDFIIHATRAMSFYATLTTTQTLPRWAPELNVGYGDAFFQFLYIAPYVVISVFHAIGLSFIASVKLLLAVSFVLSGIFMYLWMKDEYNEKTGLIAAIFYLYAPYHLIDMHFRVSIAESMSFLFIPLIFWMMYRFLNTKRKKYLVLLALSYGALLITHSITFMVTSPILLGYTLIRWGQKERRSLTELCWIVISLVFGVSLVTFYWLPGLVEQQYVYQAVGSLVEFHPAWMNLFSPWRFGFLFQGHYGEISYLIGYTQLFVVGLAVYFLYKKLFSRKERSIALLCLGFLLIYFLMMRSFTNILWMHLPLLNNIQFTYRLLEPIAFVVSVLAAITLAKISNVRWLTILLVMTVLYTLLNWGNRRTIPAITDAVLKDQLLNGPLLTGQPEQATPKWVSNANTPFVLRPEQPLEILQGKGAVTNLLRGSLEHQYIVEADTDLLVQENTFYFPGWTVFVDNTPTEVDYQTATAPGILTFMIPKGKHEVRVELLPTPVRAFADRFSQVLFGFSVIGLVFYAGTRHKNTNPLAWVKRSQRKRSVKRSSR